MKWLSLFKSSSAKQTAIGLLLGIAAFLLCFTLAVISIVYSPSVYQTSYNKGCVDPAYDIDSDNYSIFYTEITNCVTNIGGVADTEYLIKVNGDFRPVLSNDDYALVSSFNNVYSAFLIIGIVSFLIIVATVIWIAFKEKKSGISNMAIWMLVAFVACVIVLYLVIGICQLAGNDTVSGLFRLFSMDGILSYNQGNLAILFGRITMEVFASAVLKTMLIFSGIMLVIIATMVNAKFRIKKDINEDFLYQ